MIRLAKIGVVSAVLAATSLTAVTPAAARDNTGVAVIAGIVGLGLGAAIASDHPHYRQTQYYYDQTPQTYYYPQQSYGYSSGYGYGDGYGSRERYWEQRRAQDARQRQWERERYAHRRDRDDDYRGYGSGY